MSATIYVRVEEESDDRMIHCSEKRFSEEEFSYFRKDERGYILYQWVIRLSAEVKRVVATHQSKADQSNESNQSRNSTTDNLLFYQQREHFYAFNDQSPTNCLKCGKDREDLIHIKEP